jgi:phosphate-selective porin OprO/OprP
MALLFGFEDTFCREPDTPQDNLTTSERALSKVFSDTPRINALLINREIPILGGRWGSEIFIDTPLNGEPPGASVTLRKAQLSYARGFGTHWGMKVTANYTEGGGFELDDTFVNYNGWNKALLKVGVFDPPFSLDSMSSSAGRTFMEEALPVAALAERKSGGLKMLRRTNRSILDADLVFFNVSEDNIRESGQGLVLHYVYSPIGKQSANSFHVGGSLSYRFNSSESSAQFRSRPEVATMNDYYVDTGSIENSDNVARLSLEANRVSGRFSWQTEFLAARVQRKDLKTVRFWGAYAFVSWFLTQDSRNYNLGVGEFDRLKVRSPLFDGGYGAFELAFRASSIDLTDRDVIGGKEANLSLGLNWYLNDRIRLMSNLIKVLDVERPGSEYDGQDPLILSLRLQWVLE